MEFSENEIRLIKWAGQEWLLDPNLYKNGLTEVYAINHLARAAFMNNLPDCPKTQTIRRLNKALETCSAYRQTPEWEALFEWSSEPV